MKTRMKILMSAVLLLISLTYSCTTESQVYSGGYQGEVDFQLFYDQLSPYGQWVEYPAYGYVWIPEAGPGFYPYNTGGHWVLTEFGWTWVSDYPWGWAPFHYGRWDYDYTFGWFWVPGNEWGPAWVTWRRAQGYYGWAPMSPGISVGFYSGYSDRDRWCFVRDRDFGHRHIDRYIIDRRNYSRILDNSAVINNTHVDRRRNTTYISGPSADEVQRITGRRINSLPVRDNIRPGTVVNKDQIRIYRPRVNQNNDRANLPAPPRVYSRDEVNPIRERRGAGSNENIYAPNQRRIEKNQQIENERSRQQIEQQRRLQQQQSDQQRYRQQQQQDQQRIQQQRQQEQLRYQQDQQRTQPQQQLEQRRSERQQQRMQQQDQQQRQRIIREQQIQEQRELGQQKREERRAAKLQKQPEQQPEKPAQKPEEKRDQGGRRR